MRWRALGVLLLAGCAGTGGGPAAIGVPLPVGSLRPEDRVVLGDFSRVQAIAAAAEVVYVAYPSAVGVWRPDLGRWEVPRSAPGRMALGEVFSAVVDPLDRSLWLAARQGIVHFDPLIDRWDQHPLPGPLTALGLDPTDPAGGVWVRSASGWYRQPRIGAATPGIPPARLQLAPTLEDAYREIPALRGLGATLALGPGLDPGRLTAAAPSASGDGWYVGTSQRGTYFVDHSGLRTTPLSLGLRGETVGALASVPGGVWVATDDDFGGHLASLAFVPDDLARTVHLEGDPAFGLGIDAARRIVPGDRVLWLASNLGVVSVEIDGQRIRRWNETDGLVDQRVLSLVPWRGGMMAGTMRGIAFIGADGEVERPLPGMVRPVYALFAHRDTLWIGTGRGLLAHVAGSPEPVGMPAFDRALGANAPVLGIGTVGGTLMVMTTTVLLWRDPVQAEWRTAPILTATTGPLRAFHATRHGAWVGGDRGAAFVRADGAVLHTLRVGVELPAEVTAIGGDDRWLWVGTLRGLVRLALVGG